MESLVSVNLNLNNIQNKKKQKEDDLMMSNLKKIGMKDEYVRRTYDVGKQGGATPLTTSCGKMDPWVKDLIIKNNIGSELYRCIGSPQVRFIEFQNALVKFRKSYILFCIKKYGSVQNCMNYKARQHGFRNHYDYLLARKYNLRFQENVDIMHYFKSGHYNKLLRIFKKKLSYRKCIHCNFIGLVKCGIRKLKNKRGISQKYYCNNCFRYSSEYEFRDFIEFRKEDIINLRKEGMTYREIEIILKKEYNLGISHVTIYRWFKNEISENDKKAKFEG